MPNKVRLLHDLVTLCVVSRTETDIVHVNDNEFSAQPRCDLCVLLAHIIERAVITALEEQCELPRSRRVVIALDLHAINIQALQLLKVEFQIFLVVLW